MWVSSKFGTCTVVSVTGTLVEAKICTFPLESTHFIFNKCHIYTHDGASAKFTMHKLTGKGFQCMYTISLVPHPLPPPPTRTLCFIQSIRCRRDQPKPAQYHTHRPLHTRHTQIQRYTHNVQERNIVQLQEMLLRPAKTSSIPYTHRPLHTRQTDTEIRAQCTEEEYRTVSRNVTETSQNQLNTIYFLYTQTTAHQTYTDTEIRTMYRRGI